MHVWCMHADSQGMHCLSPEQSQATKHASRHLAKVDSDIQGGDDPLALQSELAREPSGIQDEVQQRIHLAVAAEMVILS